ncbi:ATP-binding protein [Mucilaginibacter corticis]|uniref:histidine kinase n=1 Tax=Mucilaginibacter corticis TaxID=2597670 RepID=A0A556M9I7_9SPHI|nr:ATP-binding protein [Mucilaginibacter corticis]TSJ36548.1 ATP-binding protein [Mucilaginibacter corticis]
MKKTCHLIWGCLILLIACKQKEVVLPKTNYSKDYNKASGFIWHQNDSAFFYFNKVANTVKDSLEIAMAYNQMGQIQSDAGDFYGSQETLLQSLKYLNEQLLKNRSCLASDYNELGISSANLQNREAAVLYYHRSLSYADDSSLSAVVTNNLAYNFQQMHLYDEAIKLYYPALEATKNPADKSRTLTNLTFTKWLQNHQYHAAPILIAALKSSISRNDLWGQNLNYDYLAQIYRGRLPDSAYFFGRSMYEVALKLQNPVEQLTALNHLILNGNPATIRSYFAKYEHLNDSITLVRNNAKNQFALIRYNAAQAKNDNLKLLKDNSDKKYQILLQYLFMAGIFVFLILFIFLGRSWYKRRKQEQQAATLHAVQETQQKDSKKVHDTLAGDIYYILKKVQSDPNIDQSWLINHIDEIYERARDLSREIIANTGENFHEYISARLTAFATDLTQVLLVGNDESLWQKISPLRRAEIKIVLQELMVNMHKHSQAASVVIRFEDIGDHFIIRYFDDGIGISENKNDGHGLKNTEIRIQAIGGKITFENVDHGGLQITIILPFS